MRSVITLPKVNRFGWNLEHCEHIVGIYWYIEEKPIELETENISNAADNADITQSQARDTRYRRMQKVNSLFTDSGLLRSNTVLCHSTQCSLLVLSLFSVVVYFIMNACLLLLCWISFSVFNQEIVREERLQNDLLAQSSQASCRGHSWCTGWFGCGRSTWSLALSRRGCLLLWCSNLVLLFSKAVLSA